jgi:hypothetical protein
MSGQVPTVGVTVEQIMSDPLTLQASSRNSEKTSILGTIRIRRSNISSATCSCGLAAAASMDGYWSWAAQLAKRLGIWRPCPSAS